MEITSPTFSPISSNQNERPPAVEAVLQRRVRKPKGLLASGVITSKAAPIYQRVRPSGVPLVIVVEVAGIEGEIGEAGFERAVFR